MNLGLPEKLAALCRELDDPAFVEQASAVGGAELLDRLRAGRSPHPERELDELNRLFEAADGLGFYPAAQRGYGPLPGARGAAGAARWWNCPDGRCSGHGLVWRGQPTPVCEITGAELVARPLTP
ncbi:hypothetical protein Acor_84100 [Acrocarpospora corrugata]|uniref:Uncharacterized protein n=1 Tax=Acrocarpospora corrugata TaxID=35763 RepID=A0A5M3WGV7_9ACTN|nr:hypothetical protein [Acrocarpospora corrugata]GES06341.1 hypothetical protein Acor_84100 [Acrocarpospora corrugata]